MPGTRLDTLLPPFYLLLPFPFSAPPSQSYFLLVHSFFMVQLCALSSGNQPGFPRSFYVFRSTHYVHRHRATQAGLKGSPSLKKWGKEEGVNTYMIWGPFWPCSWLKQTCMRRPKDPRLGTEEHNHFFGSLWRCPSVLLRLCLFPGGYVCTCRLLGWRWLLHLLGVRCFPGCELGGQLVRVSQTSRRQGIAAM